MWLFFRSNYACVVEDERCRNKAQRKSPLYPEAYIPIVAIKEKSTTLANLFYWIERKMIASIVYWPYDPRPMQNKPQALMECFYYLCFSTCAGTSWSHNNVSQTSCPRDDENTCCKKPCEKETSNGTWQTAWPWHLKLPSSQIRDSQEHTGNSTHSRHMCWYQGRAKCRVASSNKGKGRHLN